MGFESSWQNKMLLNYKFNQILVNYRQNIHICRCVCVCVIDLCLWIYFYAIRRNYFSRNFILFPHAAQSCRVIANSLIWWPVPNVLYPWIIEKRHMISRQIALVWFILTSLCLYIAFAAICKFEVELVEQMAKSMNY